MAAFHQMGNDSENLLSEDDLHSYRGAVLTPVNYVPEEVQRQTRWAQERGNFETIFDPQLYFPRAERGHLREWSYFPNDLDTADLGSDIWWFSLTDAIVAASRSVGATSVCSPAYVPGTYSDGYFDLMVRAGNHLCRALNGTPLRPVQTVVVGLPDLSTAGRTMTIASVVSRSQAGRIYLVLVGATHPRRELASVEELKGAMRLIAALKDAGLQILVGFSSSDVVLWKAAGATDCATGKFFNLRRFTPSRFEEPPEGGGQVAYWFEEALMAFLRESDLVRVRNAGCMSPTSLANPYGHRILQQLDDSPGIAWVGLGWRQFMFWFSDIEQRISTGATDVETILRQSEADWSALESQRPPILMEERQNDGTWLRAWRRALLEFRTA